jgi:hypothetical protein
MCATVVSTKTAVVNNSILLDYVTLEVALE